ncbi:hypothetical protein [Pseudomonas rubra]|uniref:AsmA-like C-terminal domain-containing protein n=1 Tax=Pseudomonas rubra TaxID=2942627 RepID=A0ABT5PC47_9PSED|nr:hypothetical protein [Pseudomonas rubra]MDD1015885.1 hypothetical protein [Pseudomonas rubra]MDD1040211.1 hypothetical protein [Pseudomonas rubra]MDD1157913.1 hypothetical protein [Pseudomonas rubra]
MQFPLEVRLDLATFRVQFTTPEKIEIKGDPQKNNFDVFGLSGKIVKKIAADKTEPFAFYLLDFSQGDVRLALAEGARLELNNGKVASGGRGLVFQVDTLGLSRSGLDLRAKVDPDAPVQLAGVDMPFRFDHGSLAIQNSQIQAFSIKGAGQLPPELVGEANATISISMGPGKNDQLIVQSAEATLDKSADPLVCHGTRFTLTLTLTLTAIGFQFQDFSKEGAGYHFYFTLSGTAHFNPRAGEFMDGLLKNFGDLVITLDKAPLARDASLLLRAIEFQVAVEPKKTVNFFNLFTFELRGPSGEVRPAFFLYGQAGKLSIEIPTPLGPVYLREVGFGFGFRYTLAAFNRADQVSNVKQLIEVGKCCTGADRPGAVGWARRAVALRDTAGGRHGGCLHPAQAFVE